MAVKIRLTRKGKRRQPSYRVVVADSRSPRDGRFIEQIGRYDPRQEPSLVEIDTERAAYWLANGAQPTGQVRKLLEIAGALPPRPGKDRRVHVVDERAQRAAEAEAATEAASDADDDTGEDFLLDDVEPADLEPEASTEVEPEAEAPKAAAAEATADEDEDEDEEE